jgi:hypothetical protein
MGVSVIESAGATLPARQVFVDPHTGQVLPISAQSHVPASFMSAIRADVGEAEAYKEALLRGEIGLQRPAGANVPGVDFITATRLGLSSIREIICTDVKTSGIQRFPSPKTVLRRTWWAEVQSAILRPRLRLVLIRTDIDGPTQLPAFGLHRLEDEIINAFAAGYVRRRQLNADYSPSGQGVISGW